MSSERADDERPETKREACKIERRLRAENTSSVKSRRARFSRTACRLTRIDSESALHAARGGRPRRSPRARAERSRRGVMSSAARGARGHATCPCCKVRLRPPDSRSFKTRHFPGKTTEVADVSVSRGTRPPATGRRAPTSRGVPPVAPRARTRRRARNRRDLRRRPPPRPPPAESLTARPSIRNALSSSRGSRGIASSSFRVILSLQTYPRPPRRD